MASVVTNTGLGDVVSGLIAANTIRYFGWGGGSGQGVGATDLASEFAESRTGGTLAAATTNTTNDTLRVTGSLTATGSRAVTEVGVFSAAVGSVLDIYGDFLEIDLENGDSIAFTIDVVVDQA